MPGPLASMMSTDPTDDPLRDGPPTPALRSAKQRTSSPGSPAAHLLGTEGSPIASVMGDMMEIQKRIQSLAQVRPDIAALFGPVIGQARDMMAGSLADLAQGGTGMPPQDAAVPPPAVGAPTGAGSGMGGPPPPSPMPMR